MFYKEERAKLSLQEEQRINETSESCLIGLTLNASDSINDETIKWLRYLGCTRVQLGVQHVDYDILKNVNRGCYREDTEKAQKLKDCGYKVDAIGCRFTKIITNY